LTVATSAGASLSPIAHDHHDVEEVDLAERRGDVRPRIERTLDEVLRDEDEVPQVDDPVAIDVPSYRTRRAVLNRRLAAILENQVGVLELSLVV
jgi:hypothetical protein